MRGCDGAGSWVSVCREVNHEGKGPTPGQNVETKENRLSIAWNILETMQSSQCPYNQTGLKRVECLWAIAGWLTGRI